MNLSVFHKSLLLFILITALVQGQFRRRGDFNSQSFQRGIFFEAIVVPEDSGAICYLPYRISYNSLVFIKEGERFIAKYSITAEASDSLTNNVFRDIVSKEISVDSYEMTLEETTYSQGLLNLKLPSGKFFINPILTDINASREQAGRQITILTNNESSGILNPILISADGNCDSLKSQVVNFEGQVPFSKEMFDLLIPVKDASVETVDVEIINNDKSIVKTTLHEYSESNIGLEECGEKIFVKNADGQTFTRNFIYRHFNKELEEGRLEVKVSYLKREKKFLSFVRWFDKPFTLVNIPFSIRILKYIADEKTIEDLLDVDEEKQYEELTAYWNKMDPTPGTAFNELMKEYYDRVDHSIKNFSAIGSKNGAETDRGKIYIQFGKPDDIKRLYDDPNNIKEVWIYKNPERQFMFTDKTGLGNFILSSNL